MSKVTVILDGSEETFNLASDGKSVLDVALATGMDVPFACKGAVCCTCRAKVMEGKATMTMNYALSDEEIAAGYVLSCQAHPATETLVISYDEP
jgi:ring-1,2-phenylacetyl-CoA epoxidase subunit PaaE